MATKQKAGYKKAAKKGSKKTVARMKPEDDGNDPPIIVSGGGGGSVPKVPGRGPGKNIVNVTFHPKGGPGSAPFPSQTNNDATITSVTIDFPGMVGIDPPKPITIKDFEFYSIRIKFNTAP